MKLNVTWTDEAKETFDHTVHQIESKWGETPAKNFVKDTNKIIALISTQPYLFSASYSSNVRKVVISKQTSMFYEVYSTHVTILFFWDNRQEPIF